jgi:hypothetical protein
MIMSWTTYLLFSLMMLVSPAPCTAVDDENVDGVPMLPVIMAAASIVSAIVAASKSIDDSPEDGPVVTGWDNKELRRKCLPSSPSYNKSIDMHSLFSALFPAQEWWANRSMLYEAMKDCSILHGFRVTSNHAHICCNRHGKSTNKRKFTGGALHQECTMIIHLKAKHSIHFPSKKGIDGLQKKGRSREDWKRETCIVVETSKNPKQKSCWKHGGKCSPGMQNLVQVSARSGIYARDVSTRHVFSLCRQATKKRLTNAQIKGALHDLFPKNTNITPQQVWHMRVKVEKLLPIIGDNLDYNAFKEYVNDESIVHGLDDEVEVDDDLAHQLASDLWIQALREDSTTGEPSVQTVTSYMNLLACSAPGFTFAIAHDDSDKATGLAWMTGTMRDNYERYAQY